MSGQWNLGNCGRLGLRLGREAHKILHLLKERGDGNKVDLREMGLMMGDSRRWVYSEDGRVLELAEDSAEWRGFVLAALNLRIL
jgi:hypothetical protein